MLKLEIKTAQKNNNPVAVISHMLVVPPYGFMALSLTFNILLLEFLAFTLAGDVSDFNSLNTTFYVWATTGLDVEYLGGY